LLKFSLATGVASL